MYLLSKKEYNLLSAVRKNPDISVEKLAKLFSMPNNFVVYHMENIEEKDYVRISYLTNGYSNDIIGVLYTLLLRERKLWKLMLKLKSVTFGSH